MKSSLHKEESENGWWSPLDAPQAAKHEWEDPYLGLHDAAQQGYSTVDQQVEKLSRQFTEAILEMKEMMQSERSEVMQREFSNDQTSSLSDEHMKKMTTMEASIDVEMLTKKIASMESIQSLNEELMRIKIIDKDAVESLNTDQVQDIYIKIEENTKASQALFVDQSKTTKELRQDICILNEKLVKQQKHTNLKIKQTIELENILSSSQKLREEYDEMEKQRMDAKFARLEMTFEGRIKSMIEDYLRPIQEENCLLAHEIRSIRKQLSAINGKYKDAINSIGILGEAIMRMKDKETSRQRLEIRKYAELQKMDIGNVATLRNLKPCKNTPVTSALTSKEQLIQEQEVLLEIDNLLRSSPNRSEV